MRRKALSTREPVVVGTFNLHGVQDNDSWRFQEIAEELARHQIDVCGLQEVVKGDGIEDTSFQIARHLYRITGNYFWTYWVHCHPFYDRYPEGISILSKYQFENPEVIDLAVTLSKGDRPLLPRFSLIAGFTIKGRKLLFCTQHLDHHPNPQIRAAQASLLVKSLTRRCSSTRYDGIFITGDFNAREESSCLRFLRRKGYRDTYRQIHRTGGNTFPACNPMERIDYILKKGRLRVTNSFIVMKKENLSDHLGVITVLK